MFLNRQSPLFFAEKISNFTDPIFPVNKALFLQEINANKKYKVHRKIICIGIIKINLHKKTGNMELYKNIN
jgi:hypothetical protein